MKPRKNQLLISVWACLMFFLLLALIRTVAVAPIGPEGTSIGLAPLNQAVHLAIGENHLLYQLTQVLGLLAIAVAGGFALLGLIQWIRRKSLWKVDREILALGVLFAVVVGLYVLFEIVVINYRPVIMPGEEHVEASFPSSHTMLAAVVFGAVFPLIKKYVKRSWLRVLLQILCVGLLVLTVVGRLLSGVHWLTDILAGAFLSTALVALYYAFLPRAKTIPAEETEP